VGVKPKQEDGGFRGWRAQPIVAGGHWDSLSWCWVAPGGPVTLRLLGLRLFIAHDWQRDLLDSCRLSRASLGIVLSTCKMVIKSRNRSTMGLC
jgi:hypothetical protein